MVTFFPGNNEIITYESNSWSSQRFYLDGSTDPKTIDGAIMTVMTSDGATLVYARQRPDEWAFDIWTKPADGSAEPTLLVGSEAVNWYPQISPDGKYLLYMSNENGDEEVFMTTFPRPSTRWEVSANGGSWPRWSPDGTDIYYIVENRLIAVPVSYDRGITLGTPQELFTMERVFWSSRWPDGFDISPDGRTFAVVRPVRDDSDVPPAIVIVQNWWAEFEQK